MSIKNDAIVILTIAYHSQPSLLSLGRDLARQSLHPDRWIVVDNSPLSAEKINLNAPFPISVIRGEEGAGFSEGCNQGLDLLLTQDWDGWVWLLNPDICLKDTCTIANLQRTIVSLPFNSLLGTSVFDSAENLEKSAGWFDPGLNFRRRRVSPQLITSGHDQPVPVDWISGCSMIFKPSSHKKEPRFEVSFPLYYEDMDFCLRMSREGVPIFWIPFVSVSHQKGEGSNTSFSRRIRLSSCSYIRFLQRHRPGLVLFLRTIRILSNALIRLPITPRRSFAVLQGCFEAYLQPLK